MALRAEQEGSALRLKGLEKQCRAARQEKEDLQKVVGHCRAEGVVWAVCMPHSALLPEGTLGHHCVREAAR